MKSFEVQDYIEFGQLVFEWADSYDKKEWERLRNILAPTLLVDYSMIGHDVLPNLNAEDFVSMINSPKLPGHPLVRTQHFIGASRYEVISENEASAVHQIRVAHQRYEDPEHTTVAFRGHAHGSVTHHFKKIDGSWKLSGVRPEHDFDKIFA